MDHHVWMERALSEAQRAADLGEVPVGAVVVEGEDRMLARAHNRREMDNDPVAHAELLAIREAATQRGNWRLENCTMYVTLEPCAMCAGALVNSRVKRLVFGAADPKAGYCGSLGNVVEDHRLNHRLEVIGGVLGEQSARMLKDFFVSLRRR